MEFSATLYMNQRDVTPWVTSLRFRQAAQTYYRGVDVTFSGWHSIETDARWDLYASYAPATPRSELVLRGGIIPPDQRGQIEIARNLATPLTVSIVDWAWLAQRAPQPSTIVIASSMSAARQAVAKATGPVGRYTAVVARTLSGAVRTLGQMAGLNVDWRLPDAAFGALVCNPQDSLWKIMSDLADPFAPNVYFRHESNTVVFADKTSPQLGIGSTLTFDAEGINALQIVGTPWRRVRQVLITVPR